MKNLTLSFCAMMVLCGILFQTGPASAQIEAPEPDTTKYKNVDIVVNYGWGEPERDNGVDVVVNYKNKKPQKVIIIKGKHRHCEITLSEDVVVKIYDHESGEQLKTLGGN